MKKLWAPWRLDYILDAKNKPNKSAKSSCIFCDVQKSRTSTKNLVLYRSSLAYVIMNKFPYSNGHLMVIPQRHTADYGSLSSKEHAQLGELMSRSMDALKAAYDPHGFNIGMNLGEAAGAGIGCHLHYHIVPRWNGDHNFMPVMSDTRVMLEYVHKTYNRLKPYFLDSK